MTRLLEEVTLEVGDAEVTIELPKKPKKPVKEKPIPVSFEADRELIDLMRLNEQLRYQQLLEAIREEENKVMEELTLMLMLDA